MIKKIIFAIESPFNKRDYVRFGIEIIKQNKFEIEVWDFTPFLHPKVYMEVGVPDAINCEECHSFLTETDALNAISKLTQDYFIACLVDYNSDAYNIYQAISKNKIRYSVFVANATPLDNNTQKQVRISFWARLKKSTFPKILEKIFNVLRHILKFNRSAIAPATFLLAGGEKTIHLHNYPTNRKTEILWLHTLDYDVYLRERNKPVQTDNKAVVFLDEYVPFHPDYLMWGWEAFSSPEKYYPPLNNFFDSLENKYGVHVVVAAHPRSHYEKQPDYFNGRAVIRGKTCELVKQSVFAIAHASTSVNFCILFRKPVIFITTDKLQGTLEGAWIDAMASSLGKRPINLNQTLDIDFEKEVSINEMAYRNYKNNYIKKEGAEDLPFWQIFVNRLKAMA